MRPRLRPGGPRRNRRQRGASRSVSQSRIGTAREPAPSRRRPRLGQRLPRIFGAARVYLKVSVLVEAGEAVRHFAAFTPLGTTLPGSLLPSRDARFLAPLPSSPPPPTPTQRAGGGGKQREGASRPEPRRRTRLSAPEAEPAPRPAGAAPRPGRPRSRACALAPGRSKRFRREQSRWPPSARVRMFSV